MSPVSGFQMPNIGAGICHPVGPGPCELGIFPSSSTGYPVRSAKAHTMPAWLCLGQRELPGDPAGFRAAIK